MKDLVKGRLKVSKYNIHDPRAVTLTEQVMVKFEEVYGSKPSPSKTVLSHIDEVVFLQKIDHPVLDDRLKDFSWDGGQSDGSVVARFREVV